MRAIIVVFAALALPAWTTRAETTLGVELATKRQRLDEMQTRAKALRAEADAAQAADGSRCRQVFLVNQCLGKAREARLKKIEAARLIEIEAAGLQQEIRRRELAERREERAKRVEGTLRPPTITVDGNAPSSTRRGEPPLTPSGDAPK